MVTSPEAPSAPTAPRGYTLVLPPGWARVPVRAGAEAAVDGILDRALAGLPRDQVATLRRDLRRRLVELAGRARDGSALDLYLPVEQAGEVTLTCSFVVAEIHEPVPEGVEPAVVLARLVVREHTVPVDLPAALGARSDRLVEADGGAPDSRRVDYVLPVPQDPGRWVVVSFSTLGAGDPGDDFAALQVELFDALMTTFRWRTS